MNCPKHGKPFRENSNGRYCPTPIKKSEDGTKVLEWCQEGRESANGGFVEEPKEDLTGKVLYIINQKQDKIIKMLEDLLTGHNDTAKDDLKTPF